MNVLPSHFHLMKNALAASKKNHEVVSHNIANVHTPDYKSQQLNFDDVYENLAQTGSGDWANGIEIQMKQGLVERADGNNVDIDAEVAALKKNALAYQTYSQILASQLTMMRRAISS